MKAESNRLRRPPCASARADLLRLALDLDSAGLRRLWLVDTALGAGCDVRHLLATVVRLEDFISRGTWAPVPPAALVTQLFSATAKPASSLSAADHPPRLRRRRMPKLPSGRSRMAGTLGRATEIRPEDFQ